MSGRRPVMVKRSGPGVLGTMARTAVIAGTATATSKAVGGAMSGAAHQAQQAQMTTVQSQADLEVLKAQIAAMQAQAAMEATTPAAPTPTPTPGNSDLLAQLQQLAQMKEMGALTDAEFQQAKAKLLG